MLEDWYARPGAEESTKLAMYGSGADYGVKQAAGDEEVIAVAADKVGRVYSRDSRRRRSGVVLRRLDQHSDRLGRS